MSSKGKPYIENELKLTPEQEAQLRASDDRSIDTSDIPELSAEAWAHARQFYKPRKQAISIRVDADVLDWLRRSSDRYQSKINDILRAKMELERA